MTASGEAAPERLAWLVDGDDSTLVANEVRRLAAELAGDQAGLSVEDFWGDEIDINAVTGACVTPPFLVDRRVVILRDSGRFTTDELAPLLGYLEHPMPTTALIVTAGGGRTPQKLVAAIKKVGHVTTTSPGRDSRTWVETRLRQAPLRFDAAARAQVVGHLGEDLGRLPALLDVLVAAYGEGAAIGPDELAPFLGDAGAVAPWAMTDAVDRGDAEAALGVLHRLLGAGDRHPLVILAILHRHVAPMLALDGSSATTEAEAAAVLGIEKGRSTYPAKKALAALRRWGSDGVARAVHLIAEADVDLRGESTWPGDMVLEVLVARLSRIGPKTSGARRTVRAAR